MENDQKGIRHLAKRDYGSIFFSALLNRCSAKIRSCRAYRPWTIN
ncbi:hypothetical protein FOQG_13505 [Fusarium oxysporum f. sp. raphani 54005]|uniref:Uncharacterized protein n=4 Tax=Fusarium oxysporum TaxID=5507 RepID=X0BIX2_FUSOX|nr:hypothetical protein FOVG_13495 [Fusarium oxysporum f. sp. pisi HDV247]EXK82120.1 hypothetical protein FOQG_13505 [Fusarium oxysporum f. sp. raphani 54005]EXL69282.1 hypothetical protein FOPG_14738 [Fusarium oxysporum f. sp. conglutinans race 2 54008]EXM18616.1 hypothetical protein FOTG_13316 [Fusarium oxysporum f. sp. vasinfectum 25433]